MSSCSFNVTVSNSFPPTMPCPASQTLSPTLGIPFVNATYNVSASGLLLVTSLTCSYPSGSTFALLTNTTAQCTAVNTGGASTTCVFYIAVVCCHPRRSRLGSFSTNCSLCMFLGGYYQTHDYLPGEHCGHPFRWNERSQCYLVIERQ